eukprot:535785-Pelagomonas_calceolata.AAC.2
MPAFLPPPSAALTLAVEVAGTKSMQSLADRLPLVPQFLVHPQHALHQPARPVRLTECCRLAGGAQWARRALAQQQLCSPTSACGCCRHQGMLCACCAAAGGPAAAHAAPALAAVNCFGLLAGPGHLPPVVADAEGLEGAEIEQEVAPAAAAAACAAVPAAPHAAPCAPRAPTAAAASAAVAAGGRPNSFPARFRQPPHQARLLDGLLASSCTAL